MTQPDKTEENEKTPFQKFQAAARKIISVPKSEVDKKIRAQRRKSKLDSKRSL
jgi:hypothetical protein